jgi:hypothetical protein
MSLRRTSRSLAISGIMIVTPLLGGFAAGCGGDEANAAPNSPTEDAGKVERAAGAEPQPSASDGGTEAAPPSGPSGTESEPNDGNPETQTNPMTVPGAMNGIIGTANDQDIFTFDVAPGEWWQWTVTPQPDLAPHLAVFDITANNLNPPRVTSAGVGTPAVLDHFVLRSGKFVAGMADTRNLPTPTGKGGPTFGYVLRAEKKTLAPTAVTFPSTKSGNLAGRGALDFYAFTATQDTTFGIVINAKRKAQPSTLDSRLSLFHLGSKTTIITNDNAGKTTIDSQIGGKIPLTGDYLVIVENEGSNVADLSYEIVFQNAAPAPAP